jgi:hypothetical protein
MMTMGLFAENDHFAYMIPATIPPVNGREGCVEEWWEYLGILYLMSSRDRPVKQRIVNA